MTGPNVLILMVDQPNGALFLDGPADWLHAPNLRALAARSRRFRNCYAASHLCAPARASFMSGLLPSRTRVYDNAAEFAPDIPTYAHHLRRAGWQACLSGKMHFVGPDQLHGFEERLTTDIYPADFGWTPDYREPGERIDWWYHNMGSVTGSGVAEITKQMEYDDAVCHHARMRLCDHGRGHDPRPWCLTVSFTHPHDPYVARHESWDLYADCGHLTPQVPQMPPEDHDPHSKRILDANDRGDFDVTKEDVRRSRRAYFATISHPDAKVGEILKVLGDTRQEAVIPFVSDHGDMLGERGLWYKMSFLEDCARVPMMICAPGMKPGPDLTPESNIDVCPTLCDLAGVDTSEVAPWTTGRKPRAPGAGRGAGYAGGDGIRGRRRLRAVGRAATGQWKYTRCDLDPEQLFDLHADPHEPTNLSGDPQHRDTLERFRAKAGTRWNPARFDATCARARCVAASPTRPCGRADTTIGTGSRCAWPASGPCATAWT